MEINLKVMLEIQLMPHPQKRHIEITEINGRNLYVTHKNNSKSVRPVEIELDSQKLNTKCLKIKYHICQS